MFPSVRVELRAEQIGELGGIDLRWKVDVDRFSAGDGLVTRKECPWRLAYGGEAEIHGEGMTSREKSVREGQCAEGVARGARTGLLEGFTGGWGLGNAGTIIVFRMRMAERSASGRDSACDDKTLWSRGLSESTPYSPPGYSEELDPSLTQLRVVEERKRGIYGRSRKLRKRLGITRGHDRAGVGVG